MRRLVVTLLAALLGCQAPVAKSASASVDVADMGTSEDDTEPDLRDVGRVLLKAEEPAVCGDAVDGMACVRGGWFLRGVDEDTHVCNQEQPHNSVLATRPAGRVWVDTFMMDVTEVTVKAYRACERAKRCDKAGPVYADYKHPKQPVTGVSWFAAKRFCEAQGKRLPTEAEWELAARGHEGELNPWGNAPAACDVAVIKDDRGRSCGKIKRRGKAPETGRVLYVDARPPQRFGLVQMVGNAEEWVADWWSPGWDACGESCEGKNPLGVCGQAETCESTPYKVLRGGSWYWGAGHATGYHRRKALPGNKPFHHFGFRCAKALDE